MKRWLLPAFLLAHTALADPPANIDLSSPTHAWFEQQHATDGAWCCNVSDGHILDDSDWRHGSSAYEVRINGDWLTIPLDAMRDPKGGPNPTGHAIVWYTVNEYGIRIYCFAPGFEY